MGRSGECGCFAGESFVIPGDGGTSVVRLIGKEASPLHGTGFWCCRCSPEVGGLLSLRGAEAFQSPCGVESGWDREAVTLGEVTEILDVMSPEAGVDGVV